MKFVFAIILVLMPPILWTQLTFAQGASCKAGTWDSVAQCITQLNAGTVSSIEITGHIICTSTTPCQFNIKNATGGTIFGTPGSNAGFTRSGKYNKQIMSIEDSSNVTVSNLTINDDTQNPCDYTSTNNCVSQMSVSRSTGVAIQGLTMTNSKQQALILGNLKDFKLFNSTFSNTYSQEVWMDTTMDGVLIEGNTFRDGGGSGTFLRGNNLTVRNNTYTHNQWNPPWVIQGGQALLRGVQNSLFTKNTIMNGNQLNHFTSGIELDSNNVNLIISDNYIHDNTGSGIVNDATGIMNNVIIEKNRIVRNRTTIDDLSGKNTWTLRENCFTEPCPTPTVILKLGDLNADRKVDIFDFNLLIGNFGKTGSNMVGDIDKNSKVDIFDYNELVANFGK